MTRTAAALALVVLAAGCTPVAPPALEASQFYTIATVAGRSQPGRPAIALRPGGRMSGYAVCDVFSGRWRADGEAISITVADRRRPPICSASDIAEHERIEAALRGAVTWTPTATGIVLSDRAGRPTRLDLPDF